jgi:hypothetical protein
LKGWSRRKHKNNKDLLKEKSKQLAALQQFVGARHQGAIKRLQGEIEWLLDQKDTKWKQMAKQSWY